MEGAGDGRVSAFLQAYNYVPVPDLTAEATVERTDGDIYGILSDGILVMPSFKNLLSAEDRWLLVDYVRELQDASLGPAFPRNVPMPYDTQYARHVPAPGETVGPPSARSVRPEPVEGSRERNCMAWGARGGEARDNISAVGSSDPCFGRGGPRAVRLHHRRLAAAGGRAARAGRGTVPHLPNLPRRDHRPLAGAACQGHAGHRPGADRRGPQRRGDPAVLRRPVRERVLASPPREGFHWLVWTAPPVGIALGLLALFWVTQAMARRPPEPQDDAESDDDLSPYLEQVDLELSAEGGSPSAGAGRTDGEEIG